MAGEVKFVDHRQSLCRFVTHIFGRTCENLSEGQDRAARALETRRARSSIRPSPGPKARLHAPSYTRGVASVPVG